jgi:glucose/mannose-6-phosphate isomerase
MNMSLLSKSEVLDNIENFDKTNYYKYLMDFPSNLKEAKQIAQGFSLPKDYENIKNIIFCGMGGSRIGGEILLNYCYDKLSLPFIINSNYSIPTFINTNSLFIVSSYSGNTEETFTSFLEAKKRNAKIIIISSDGKLLEIAMSENIPYLKVPLGFPPRCAISYIFLFSYYILVKLGLISERRQMLENSIKFIDELIKNYYGINVPTSNNLAKKTALKFKDKIIVIYGEQDLSAIIYRWRTQLEENAKHLSFSHVLPEMNHNEIQAWQNSLLNNKKIAVVFLRDKEENLNIKKSIEFGKEIISSKVDVFQFYSQGESLFSRFFSLILLGDFISYYLALIKKVNPLNIDVIEKLKRG